MSLLKENAIRKETKRYNSQSYAVTYVFVCKKEGCGREIRSNTAGFKTHSGFCASCSHRGKPYGAIYNELASTVHNKGRLDVTLTYEEFVKLTEIKNCHYCGDDIIWHKHTKTNGQDVKGARSYKLDRMDNDRGYHKDNVVVCCWKCNSGKGSRFTYREWFDMTFPLRESRRLKNLDSKMKNHPNYQQYREYKHYEMCNKNFLNTS